jgi:hypothetical protein
MMNQELGAGALTADVLDSVFEMWWPKLEEKVKKVLSNIQGPAKQSVRSERDILEEILARVRATPSVAPRAGIHPEALEDLLDTYERLMVEVSHLSPEARGELLEIVEQLRRPVDHIVSRAAFEEDVSPMRRERLTAMRHRFLAGMEPQLPALSEGTIEKDKPSKRVNRPR